MSTSDVTDRGAYESAVRNLHRSLDALRPALATVPGKISPEAVQGLQATELAWRGIDSEFGLLTGSEVAKLLESRARGRNSYAADKRRAGQLIGIRRGNALLYPGFQFDTTTSSIRPAIPRLIGVARKYERSDGDLAQWLCDPSGYFAGERPVDHLDDVDSVVSAAANHYGVEW